MYCQSRMCQSIQVDLFKNHCEQAMTVLVLSLLGCEASIMYIFVCDDIMLSILEFPKLCFVWTVCG